MGCTPAKCYKSLYDKLQKKIENFTYKILLKKYAHQISLNQLPNLSNDDTI